MLASQPGIYPALLFLKLFLNLKPRQVYNFYLPKECEAAGFDMVFFSSRKVFDVRLNGHVVVKDLDIFDRVGHSTAHDEIIPMSIRKGKLSVLGEVSTFTGKLYIEFVKVTLLLCPPRQGRAHKNGAGELSATVPGSPLFLIP